MKTTEKEKKTIPGGMIEYIVICLFSAMLIACVIADISIVFALLAGFILFFIYALSKGIQADAILKASFSGILKIKNILITFILIGMLTGLWRACGTIASIVNYSSLLIRPSLMILLTFLLTCLISVLTGTAFGSAATMGTICMTMALTMNINPLYEGGAILAGAYFGDRCSPVSTSALLVSELTETDIYENIRGMIKTAGIPFVISAALYFIIGKLTAGNAAVDANLLNLFREQFSVGFVPLLPAIIIFALAVFRVKVKLSMAISIAAAAVIGIVYQNLSIQEIFHFAVFGYKAGTEELAAMINGGGITSMIRVFLIVGISSCYSGIFEISGLLKPVQGLIEKMSCRMSAFAVIVPVSVAVSMIACNQTLSIMLTNQLCRPLEKDEKKFALYLENSVVVLAALIPWSIAGAVPLASCGAPPLSRVFAFFLYLLPLTGLVIRGKF